MFCLPHGSGWRKRRNPDIIERLLAQMQEIFDFIVIDGGQSLDKTSLQDSGGMDVSFSSVY